MCKLLIINLDDNIMRNPYRVLNINEDSTKDEIKRAYHSLILKYHPDKNKDEDAKEKFQEITLAYKYLSNNLNRFMYKWTSDKQDSIFSYFNNISNTNNTTDNLQVYYEYTVSAKELYMNEPIEINGYKVEPRIGLQKVGNNTFNLIYTDDKYKFNENDIIVIKNISLYEYLYGGILYIDHCGGHVITLKIDNVIETTPIYSIKNEGIKKTDGYLYVILKVLGINSEIKTDTDMLLRESTKKIIAELFQ